MIGAFGIAMVVSAELLAVPLAKIFVSYDAELMKMTVSGFRILRYPLSLWATLFIVRASLRH